MENEKIVIKENGLKYSTAGLLALFVFAIGFVVGFGVSKKYAPSIEMPVVTIRTDTVTVRDTIAGKPLPPKTTVITRVDTLRLQINSADGGKYQKDTTTRQSTPDTSTTPRIGKSGELLIPISKKVYQTDDYRVVVSGWRPHLDSVEVYKDTQYINRTETRTIVQKKRPWLALTVGGSLSYAGKDAPIQAFGVGLRPTVGVGLGVVLKSW